MGLVSSFPVREKSLNENKNDNFLDLTNRLWKEEVDRKAQYPSRKRVIYGSDTQDLPNVLPNMKLIHRDTGEKEFSHPLTQRTFI